jgi:hypothetical protein
MNLDFLQILLLPLPLYCLGNRRKYNATSKLDKIIDVITNMARIVFVINTHMPLGMLLNNSRQLFQFCKYYIERAAAGQNSYKTITNQALIVSSSSAKLRIGFTKVNH